MGLLPRYRGMDVVEWPILEGRNEVGVTLHFMDRGVDTGPILTTRNVPIRAGDGMEALRTRFEPVMVDIMLEGIRGVRDDALPPAAQRPEDGRQYFVLHPRLYERARRRLADVSSQAQST
jgi:methionyl-tRNA formyltransferase